MHVLIRTHRYHWVCPECGPIEDESVEVQVDGKGVGRWFQDGHQGFSAVDENAVEFTLCEHLGIDFLVLEHVRALRSRRRKAQPDLGSALDREDRRLLDARIEGEGHSIVRWQQDFTSTAPAQPPAA